MTAIITPFDRNGELDYEAHGHNLTVLFERGIKGFVLAGSTGEGPYLEAGERTRLLEVTQAALGRKAWVMMGIAAETLRGALSQLAEAEEAGADAVLVLSPTSLARNRASEITLFYRDVASATSLPVWLYSVPPYTAYELPNEVAAELSQHPNITGMKDSGGDPVRMGRLRAASADDFRLYVGASRSVSLAIAAGADGAITASGNYAPELLAEVVARARRSPSAAREAQTRLTDLSAAVESFGVAGVKAAAQAIGLRPGLPRRPLLPLRGARAAKLADLVH